MRCLVAWHCANIHYQRLLVYSGHATRRAASGTTDAVVSGAVSSLTSKLCLRGMPGLRTTSLIFGGSSAGRQEDDHVVVLVVILPDVLPNRTGLAHCVSLLSHKAVHA